MRRLLTLLAGLLMAVASWAQKEQDFASRYMALYAQGTTLSCTTVSPLMMERLLRLPSVDDNEQMRQVLAQLKSIRMATNTDAAETAELHRQAVRLARRNSARYKLWGSEDDSYLYTRRRGRVIVEVVLIMKRAGRFCLVDLTGNMDDRSINRLLHL